MEDKPYLPQFLQVENVVQNLLTVGAGEILAVIEELMELYIFIIYSTFALAVCRPAVADISCEEDVHIYCPNKPYVEEGFSLFNDEMLKTHCSDILEDIECKGNYLSICDPKGHRMFVALIGGFKSTFSELCNETSILRNKYRRHATCLRNSRHLYHNCVLNAIGNDTDDETTEESNNTGGEWKIKKLVKRLCRLYAPIKSCVSHETVENCDAHAKNFVETLIDGIASRFVEEKCS